MCIYSVYIVYICTEGEDIVVRWSPWGQLREYCEAAGSFVGMERSTSTMECGMKIMGWNSTLWDASSLLWDGMVYYGISAE